MQTLGRVLSEWRMAIFCGVTHQVDCTTNTKTCTDVGIRGYPSLMLFRDGELETKYDGGRTLDAMNAFVQEATGELQVAPEEAVDKTVGPFVSLAF